MEKYWEITRNAYGGYANYLWNDIFSPTPYSYFYWLVGLSLIVWGLEWCFPWRTEQHIVRKDFWLDVFYMFFNFFLFSLVLYNALSMVVVEAFKDFLLLFGIRNLVVIKVGELPAWGQMLLLFVLRDFIQWNIHRLLHHSTLLWRFHKVHHSIEEMGFAGHLRYHFMENVIYRTLEYVPLAMVGFGISDFFMVHIFTLLVGHLNHANIYLPLGKLRYVFNSPQMHIWHHAKHLPEGSKGVNFGLTLSIWDYLFGTAYQPHNGKNEALGFEKDEAFKNGTFGEHLWLPFKK